MMRAGQRCQVKFSRPYTEVSPPPSPGILQMRISPWLWFSVGVMIISRVRSGGIDPWGASELPVLDVVFVHIGYFGPRQGSFSGPGGAFAIGRPAASRSGLSVIVTATLAGLVPPGVVPRSELLLVP